MLIESKPIEPTFKPVKLSLTLETREEAEAFYAIFNFQPIVDALPAIDAKSIRRAVSRASGLLLSLSGNCPGPQTTSAHRRLLDSWNDKCGGL